jgi:hypothetical protein
MYKSPIRLHDYTSNAFVRVLMQLRRRACILFIPLSAQQSIKQRYYSFVAPLMLQLSTETAKLSLYFHQN